MNIKDILMRFLGLNLIKEIIDISGNLLISIGNIQHSPKC